MTEVERDCYGSEIGSCWEYDIPDLKRSEVIARLNESPLVQKSEQELVFPKGIKLLYYNIIETQKTLSICTVQRADDEPTLRVDSPNRQPIRRTEGILRGIFPSIKLHEYE